MIARIVALILLGATAVGACDLDLAKKLFKELQTKSDAYDPSVAECYSDDAVFENTRHYPDGRTRVMTLSGTQYKKLLRTAMPLAKARKDRSEFRDVKFSEIDGIVAISAKRWSVLKEYESPYLAHVEVTDGVAKIVKEVTESKP